MTVTPPLGLIN